MKKYNKILDKLDLTLLITTRLYEDKYDIIKLQNELYQYIYPFKTDESTFNIRNINKSKFNLVFIISVGVRFLYLNIDFLSTKDNFIFYIYNDINIISKNGEILKDITNDSIIYLNKKNPE